MTQTLVLLVDDEPMILASLRRQLRHLYGATFSYETAESVSEAWEVLDAMGDTQFQLVLIVSDWLMPGTRGDEFLTDVRKRFPSAMRVMLTGHADPQAIARAYEEAEVDRVLYKPWSPEDLQEIVDRAMRLAS